MTDKKDVKQETEKEPKLEGLKVIGGKDSYNPAKKKKEIEEIVYTSPVRIGDKEYVIKPLSMLDIKKLNIERNKVKKDDDIATYDFSFHTLLAVIKKWNPDTKDLTLDQFEEMIDIAEFVRIQEAILQISGLKKFFRPGISKK